MPSEPYIRQRRTLAAGGWMLYIALMLPPPVVSLRSALFLPASNSRALEKARTLETDALILDLEDSVAPERKAEARERAHEALERGFDHTMAAVRINALNTPWGTDDVQRLRSSRAQAVVVPKVETPSDLPGLDALPLWAMLETPLGILNAREIAADPRVTVLILGSSDLIADLRARHIPRRENLHHAMSTLVTCARAYGKLPLDGVYLDYHDPLGLEVQCVQARDFGFAGKTLIHPSQLEVAHRVFSATPPELEQARRVLEVWEAAVRQGQGVATLEGRLIEELHVREARRTLGLKP